MNQPKKHKNAVNINQFIIIGTDSILVAAKAIKLIQQSPQAIYELNVGKKTTIDLDDKPLEIWQREFYIKYNK